MYQMQQQQDIYLNSRKKEKLNNLEKQVNLYFILKYKGSESPCTHGWDSSVCNHTELGQARVFWSLGQLPLWRPVDKRMSSVVVLKYIINSEAHTKSNIVKRRVGMARTRTP